ncbi:alanine racemase C-terminal domain-containing protein [Microbacterium sp. NPDC058345]|uniref:alanine racemase C-terminal domain-containing protein n=1 Tax=Microbacterium sp. NPDC058345 TaxID=3346455 RepID=UPI003657E9C5
MAIHRSTATRAVISRSALSAAADDAVASGGRVADLRRDAFGHGLLPVARAVLGAGVERVRVDDDDQERMLRGHGLNATTRDEPDIDPALLYGLPDDAAPERRPVMRLAGRVMSLKPLRRGEAVSYGYTHRAPSDTTVALVTGGYAQAIVRALGNRADVEVLGTLRPIVGRVAMDVCVVDLQDPGHATSSDIKPGAEVTFFGGTGPARRALREWSTATGLTTTELVCAAGLRASRGEED